MYRKKCETHSNLCTYEDTKHHVKIVALTDVRNKMKTPKIALIGKARSGKDTAAKMLCEKYPELQPYALAQPIKEVINALLNVSPEVAETQKDLELNYYISLELLQKASSIYRIKYFKKLPDSLPVFYDLWEYLLLSRTIVFSLAYNAYAYKGSLRKLYQIFGTEFGRSIDNDVWLKLAPENAIITDVRFDNEAAWLSDKGYTTILITRDTSKYRVRPHISEYGVDPRLIDVTLDNSGTLEDLREMLSIISLE